MKSKLKIKHAENCCEVKINCAAFLVSLQEH